MGIVKVAERPVVVIEQLHPLSQHEASADTKEYSLFSLFPTTHTRNNIVNLSLRTT